MSPSTRPSVRRQQQARAEELRPWPAYMSAHCADVSPEDHLNPQMRLIVASWLVEVTELFGLQPETLHLAVALMDRVLSATQVRCRRACTPAAAA